MREQIQEDLQNGKVPEGSFVLLSEVTNHLPMKSTGFSDFYTSLEHCQNVSHYNILCVPAHGKWLTNF